MRFITEFEELHHDFIHRPPSDIKTDAERDLGHYIAKSFGWQTPKSYHHRLEIEAFPMEKWIEFKQKLHDYLHVTGWVSGAIIFKMIEELESFGKPAGV